ncbi:hypothetical protein [Runella salmonicolor]|uniref:Lipoprotein n=1 Tax=Runella salmonicolor TaxID=2950278 RepID=A0ABT1FJF4_9BACT|nr:hypothetical protein [Runella salmonicolor]MCP1381907.1 hypothetical protein [Runella salmonicolor]
MKLKYLLFASTILLFLWNCNGVNNSTKSENDISKDSLAHNSPIDSLVFVNIPVDTSYTNKAGGSEKATWKKIFKKCAKSDWIRTAEYMGPTNTLYLGAIQNENGDAQNDLGKADSVRKAKPDFINEGGDQNTALVEKITNSLNTILASELQFKDSTLVNLNAELNAAIENTQQMNLTFTWAADNLLATPLKRYINDNEKTPKWADYKADLLTPGNKVITKVIRVANFKGTISLDHDISGGLKAKLVGGQKIQLANGNADINIKMQGNRVITVESSPKTVYVFAVWSNVESVKF